MCGIAGTVGTRDTQKLPLMLAALEHRGPDDEGIYADPDRDLLLGHRRLAIIDLSSAGHQPMSDKHKQIWVTFNGEIYNYKQLRADLTNLGYVFGSNSDTEVLVHGYAAYGIDIFRKIDGMWAIALYDREHGTLHLSRDPAGIKPLYLYKKDTELLFASEIGALTKVISRPLPLDNGAVAQFLAHGYIYTNTTIYSEITEIPCGTTLTIDLATFSEKSTRHFTPTLLPPPRNFNEAIEKFDYLFNKSVVQSLQSDVPVGLFLSGGIDSSLVGHYAKKNGASLHAFTIGFDQPDFDESNVATRIATHLGFPHTNHVLQASDIEKDIMPIFDSFGEPFADTSALPTYYVSKLAREHGYTVALAGDGADELFGGYPTHFLPSLAKLYRMTPRLTDSFLQQFGRIFSNSEFTKLGTEEKINRFIYGARHHSAHARWKRIFTEHEYKMLVTPDAQNQFLKAETDFESLTELAADDDAANQVMHLDFFSFLTGDCLVKSDVCSMQTSLEIRVPFLNKEMIDFAWHLPSSFKVRPFKTKLLLRQVLAQSLPAEFTRLPKQGFTPPISKWLCKELEPCMRSILTKENIACTGFLSYTYVMTLIEEHVSGRRDHGKKLWSLMSLVHFYSRH